MSTTVVAFFNDKGGTGTTTLAYHLAWMYAELGFRVLVADMDPQADLTAAFLDDDALDALLDDTAASTVHRALVPLLRGTGDLAVPKLVDVDSRLALLPGDLGLSRTEDEFARQWAGCLDGDDRAFGLQSALWRCLQMAAHELDADIVLTDLGPNLGAVNRAALVAADYVCIPVAPDVLSVRGLMNTGAALRQWRAEWSERRRRPTTIEFELPTGGMQPSGYVVMLPSFRLDRPVRLYEKCISSIPSVYRDCVPDQTDTDGCSVSDDPRCLALLKHYPSLGSLAREARKPMFALKAADGAMGAHLQAAQDAFKDFRSLALELAGRVGVARRTSEP